MTFKRLMSIALITVILSVNSVSIPALGEDEAPAVEEKHEEKKEESRAEEKQEERQEAPREEKPAEPEKEPEAPAEPSKEEAEQPAEAPVEVEIPSETDVPGETAAPVHTELPEGTELPAETELPDVTEAPTDPDASLEPVETLEPTETPEPTPGPVSLSVSGPSGRYAFLNEHISFSCSATNAESVSYCLSGQGGVISSGELSPEGGSYSFSPSEAGEYTFQVTANGVEGDSQSASASVTVVDAPALSVSVSADDPCCHAGDMVSFTLSVPAGLELASCSIKVWQNSNVFYETGSFVENLTVNVPGASGVTKVTLSLSVKDIYGRTGEASVTIPCAVHAEETRASWEASVSGVNKTGVWPEDLIAIAQSQVGYKESSVDFGAKEGGGFSGYTRYGDWAGLKYEEWCAMFASFCLHYAGIPEAKFPYASNCQRWINRLRKVDLYASRYTYNPQPGDLVFFEWQGDNDSDHVGIIYEVDTDKYGNVQGFKTIEGNSRGGAVTNDDYYGINDGRIVGYGLVNTAYERELENQVREITVEYDDYTVTATVEPEAKLPGRLELKAKENSPSRKNFDTLVETLRGAIEDGQPLYARFLRVYFLDGNGDEVKPEAPVTLTVRYNEKLDFGDASAPGVVLLEDETTAGEINREVELSHHKRATTFSFSQQETGLLCTFISGNPDCEAGTLRAAANGISARVRYSAEALIPDGAELTIRELEPDSREYVKAVAQLEDVPEDAVVRVFDLRATLNNLLLKPDRVTETQITCRQSAQNAKVVRLWDGRVRRCALTRLDNGRARVSFKTGSFGLFAVIYTE